jgi:hypothetical protein
MTSDCLSDGGATLTPRWLSLLIPIRSRPKVSPYNPYLDLVWITTSDIMYSRSTIVSLYCSLPPEGMCACLWGGGTYECVCNVCTLYTIM